MLQKGFLRDRYKLHISKRRFLASVVLGLGASLCIYVFFCGFQLVYRIMECDMGNGPLIYSESSRYLQNINFAVLSLALGNSIFLGTIFKISSKSNLPSYKRISIQNNQAFLGFGFFVLFAQSFTIAGIVTSLVFDPMMFSTSTPLFVLIALVLFFESYKGILRLFRKKAFKLMWVNLLVLAVLTFGLASNSIFDFNRLDELMLAQNPPVDVPESSFKSLPHRHRGRIIKLIYEGGEVRYQVDGAFMNLEQLRVIFRDKEYSFAQYYGRGEAYLLAPKSVPMGEIWKIEDELYLTEQVYLMYVTNRPKPLSTSRFELKGIKKHLYSSAHLRQLTNGKPQPPLLTEEFIAKQKIVRVQIEDGFVAQGNRLTKAELLPYFKKTIDSTTLFYFKYDETVLFENYMTLYGSYRQAVYELRKEDEIVALDEELYNEGGLFFKRNNEEAYEADQRRIQRKYPARYIENYEFESVDRDSEETEN